VKLTALILFLTLGVASAMDRRAALSQLETGDNDRATGRAHERSRFQIRPADWYANTSTSIRQATNPATAWIVAERILKPRIAHFVAIHHRQPTDFEWYVLWNAPAQTDHASPAVTERAVRFSNLCAH
jgi:hypothetical protein